MFDVSDSAPQSGQRERALARANEVRVARAQLKRQLRQGRLKIDEVLVCPPEQAAGIELLSLLLAVPGVGPVKAGRLLKRAGINGGKPIAGLSQRQRARLLELLSP